MSSISLRTSIVTAAVGALCVALALPATAQTLRDAVSGARLAPGYALILNAAAAPDLSAAHYDVGDSGSGLSIDVLRAPYQRRWLALGEDADLYWKVVGGYLTMDTALPVNSATLGPGRVDTRWSAYSLMGGLLVRWRIADGLTFVPAFDMGVARLQNDASYVGAAGPLQPLFDNLLFNWNTKAQLVTPNAGLEWTAGEPDRRTSVSGHVAWSWISSFGESDPVLSFRETAGTYSIRAEHFRSTGAQIAQRSLGVLVHGGFTGFLGANRNALGFSSVAELGLTFDLPLLANDAQSQRLRFGASYLFGPDVRGYAVSLRMRF